MPHRQRIGDQRAALGDIQQRPHESNLPGVVDRHVAGQIDQRLLRVDDQRGPLAGRDRQAHRSSLAGSINSQTGPKVEEEILAVFFERGMEVRQTGAAVQPDFSQSRRHDPRLIQQAEAGEWHLCSAVQPLNLAVFTQGEIQVGLRQLDLAHRQSQCQIIVERYRCTGRQNVLVAVQRGDSGSGCQPHQR